MADASGCDPVCLNDPGRVERALREAAERGGATLLDLTIRAFQPQGMTAVALLAESHASVHTWPEHRYAAIDAFTCGDADPRVICRCIAEALGAANVRERTVERGVEDDGSAGHADRVGCERETADV